eukprot:scaffold1410_cov47-Attheya_sp.AAC.2
MEHTLLPQKRIKKGQVQPDEAYYTNVIAYGTKQFQSSHMVIRLTNDNNAESHQPLLEPPKSSSSKT